MIFKQADVSDAGTIADAMVQIRENLEDKQLYVIDTKEDIQYSLDGIHGFGLLALNEKRLAGYFVFRYPDVNEADHLSVYSQLDDVQKQCVVYMDSVGVLPEFRGLGIQDRLLKAGEAYLAHTKYSHAFATVSPDNPASLRNFQKNGYKILATAEKYGGLMRHILYKKLR